MSGKLQDPAALRPEEQPRKPLFKQGNTFFNTTFAVTFAEKIMTHIRYQTHFSGNRAAKET